MKKHRPHHLKETGTYFITGRTYGGVPHITKDSAKEKFKQTLLEKIKKYSLHLYAWVVLDNHYHILLDTYKDPGVLGVPCVRVAEFTPRKKERELKFASLNNNSRSGRAYQCANLDNPRELKFANLGREKCATLPKSRVAGFSPRQEVVAKFIRELHGATSFKIKKLPPTAVLNESQIAYRTKTYMEERIDRKLDTIIAFLQERALKCATLTTPRVADFSPRQNKRVVNRATSSRSRVADFSPRKKECSATLKESKIISKLGKAQKSKILSLLNRDEKTLAKIYLMLYLPDFFDVPFWYQYLDHFIEDETDFYHHFNYIHQNCVKHGYVEKVRDYNYSSFNFWVEMMGSGWVGDVLREYPVIDFRAKWLE